MKQKLYAIFIEKLKLSENDPYSNMFIRIHIFKYFNPGSMIEDIFTWLKNVSTYNRQTFQDLDTNSYRYTQVIYTNTVHLIKFYD